MEPLSVLAELHLLGLNLYFSFIRDTRESKISHKIIVLKIIKFVQITYISNFKGIKKLFIIQAHPFLTSFLAYYLIFKAAIQIYIVTKIHYQLVSILNFHSVLFFRTV